MIYTYLTKKALLICYNAHKNQLDKSGVPYVFHPYHLSEQMNDEYSVCTALLHDVVEDTPVTLDYLKKEGFPNEVLEAIALMTHDKNEPYFDYVRRIKNNPIAKKVKLADLKHNSDTSRLNYVDEKTLARCEKYKQAIRILEE